MKHVKFKSAGKIKVRFQEATPMKPRKIEVDDMEYEEWEVDIKFPRILSDEDSACSEASIAISGGVVLILILIFLGLLL